MDVFVLLSNRGQVLCISMYIWGACITHYGGCFKGRVNFWLGGTDCGGFRYKHVLGR